MDRDEDSSDDDDLSDEIEKFEFTKWIVFKEDSTFMFYWKALLIICSLFSSYMYALLAVFGFANSMNFAVTMDFTLFVIFTF